MNTTVMITTHPDQTNSEKFVSQIGSTGYWQSNAESHLALSVLTSGTQMSKCPMRCKLFGIRNETTYLSESKMYFISLFFKQTNIFGFSQVPHGQQ